MTNITPQIKPNESRRSKFLKNVKEATKKVTLSKEQKLKLKQQKEAYQEFKYLPEKKTLEDKFAQFKEILTSQSAEIYECYENQINEKLEEILKEKPYGQDLLIGKNIKINSSKNSAINFTEVESFEKNKENYNLNCALTTAFAAASETGTLFLNSGCENPTWLNYLATCHIVLLDKNSLCQTYEEAFAEGKKEAELNNKPFPPRSINMISGPSRTADIEQTLTLGAHGPIELIIIVYTSERED